MGGRLKHVKWEQASAELWILPRKSAVMTLILKELHRKEGHTGYTQVLVAAREKFWVMGGAKTARNATFACLVCRRVSKQPVCQKIADLPELRCEIRPPFEAVGMDCFGLVNIKEGQKMVKR